MTLPSYTAMHPAEGEDAEAYCRRLEQDGYEEMFIRKALRCHFGFGIDELGAFFEPFEQARLRHLTWLKHLAPNRTEYSFQKKVASNLGISTERAIYWVQRFQEVGEVQFNGMTASPLETRTLEEIENDRWGEPEVQSHLVTTCHRLRKKPLGDYSEEDLRIMIGQQISLPTLIPMAITKLDEDPLAEGDFYPGDLLQSVLNVDGEWYLNHPTYARRLADISERAIVGINADADEFPAEADLTQELLEVFERYSRLHKADG